MKFGVVLDWLVINLLLKFKQIEHVVKNDMSDFSFSTLTAWPSLLNELYSATT